MASIDAGQLLLLAGADIQQMRNIVDHFRKDALSTIRDCETAAQSNDVTSCKRLIHRLKGSSGSLGFTELYEVCLNLESSDSAAAYLESMKDAETLVIRSVELALDMLDRGLN